MNKKLLLTIVILFTLIPLNVKADESSTNIYGEPYKIRCTCYTAPQDAITSSGQKVREGIIAGKPEWEGCTAVIYENNNGKVGDIIGLFEVLDTGGKPIKNGKVIDVFRDTLDGCNEWIAEHGDYVFVQIIPGIG